MVDVSNHAKTHSIFEAKEIPWKFRGENKPDHLDVVELVRKSGIELRATFENAAGEDFDPGKCLSIVTKVLRFRRGQVIPTHTHLADLYREGIVVMLKRITTFRGGLFYTDGTDDEDNGYQELWYNQWAVLDTRRTYYGEILTGEDAPEYVEMDLWSLSFRRPDGSPVALDPAMIVSEDVSVR